MKRVREEKGIILTMECLARKLKINDFSEIPHMTTIEFLKLHKDIYIPEVALDELIRLKILTEPEEEVRVNELPISTRVKNLLKKNSYIYISQLQEVNGEEISKIYRLGEKGYNELMAAGIGSM